MAVRIDQLIRSKRKTLQISISPEAKLVVRAPLRLPIGIINRFIEEKREWIERKKAEVSALKENFPRMRFSEGETYRFLGSSYPIYISDKHTEIRIIDSRMMFPAVFMTNPAEHLERWYMEQARRYIGNRLGELSVSLDMPFKSFGITRARRRWGSCSSKNALNFAWRLIQADREMIDYVIVHELCHLSIKNHSRAFWNMVEGVMPDYRRARKWLRDHRMLMEIL